MVWVGGQVPWRALQVRAAFRFMARAERFTREEQEIVEDLRCMVDLMQDNGDGSLAVCWRRHFKREFIGALGFQDFCRSMQKIGFDRDVTRVWKVFEGEFSLAILDPLVAHLANEMANWCDARVGGPTKLFLLLDELRVECVTTGELLRGLRALGFFSEPGQPPEFTSEDAFLRGFYPVMDPWRLGIIEAADVIFMEPDPRRHMEQVLLLKDVLADRTKHVRQRTPTNEADKLLKALVQQTTPLGGKHWMMNAQVDFSASSSFPYEGETRTPTPKATRSKPTLPAVRSPKAERQHRSRLPPEEEPATDPVKKQKELRRAYGLRSCKSLPSIRGGPSKSSGEQGRSPEAARRLSLGRLGTPQTVEGFLRPGVDRDLYERYYGPKVNSTH